MATTTGEPPPATDRPLPSPSRRRQPALLRQMLVQPQPVLDELAAELGPVFALGAGPLRMVVLGEPSVVHQLLAMPTSAFRWGHPFNVIGFVTGPTSVIVSDGADWKRRRSPVQAAFSRRRLNRWIPTILQQTDDAIDALVADLDGGTREMDLYPIGRRLVLGIVVRTLFGSRMGERADEIGDLMQRPQDYLESPGIRQIPHPFPHTARARVKADRVAFDRLIDEQIALRRRDPSGDPLDVLEALVAESDLTDAEIRDQVVTLIGAGYDTTAASLAWILRRIPLVPGLLDRLRAEADAVLGPIGDGPAPDEGTLARLDLAERSMRETLRLHPAGSISPRQAAEDVDVAGYHIRKGTMILWSPYLAGRDPSAWDDPLAFDPDRFVDLTAEQAAIADQAWVPFGRGPRACIGFALAQIELTLILSRIAQRLDLTPVSTEVPEPRGMVVNRPTGGAPLGVAARP